MDPCKFKHDFGYEKPRLALDSRLVIHTQASDRTACEVSNPAMWHALTSASSNHCLSWPTLGQTSTYVSILIEIIAPPSYMRVADTMIWGQDN